MSNRQKKGVEQPNNTLDKNIVLNYQQIITYSIFLITFGASVYTFYKEIPKIESLDKEVNNLNKNVAVFEQKISNLTFNLKLYRVLDTTTQK